MPMRPKSHRQRVRAAQGDVPPSVVKRRDHDESPSARGYDRAWVKLRRWHISKEPLCRQCKSKGLTVPVEQVDHIVPFKGLDDPLRLDATNLQSLCATCHSRKTARQRRKRIREHI